MFIVVDTQVISETLRRATILPWFSRKAAQNFEIDGTIFCLHTPHNEKPNICFKLMFTTPSLIIWFLRDFPLLTGYKIEKGWSINLDVVSIHHDPEVFPDPEKFDPSRFDVSAHCPYQTF